MKQICFSRAVLMVRGSTVQSAVEFYNKALGFQVARITEDWAELTCNVLLENNRPSETNSSSALFRLTVKAVDSEAQLSTGYSPFLSFHVNNMDTTVAHCVQMGAHLDGPILYPAHGKVATLRSPDGHMIGLYEPATDT